MRRSPGPPARPAAFVIPRKLYRVPLPGGRALDLGARTLVMGILNVTPDSFADDVALTDPALAVDAALRMEADGADIIDVGGESTRPGAEPVPAAEELRRVVPVVERVARQARVPVSIDTYKAEVARAAIDAGASMVNDVSGLRYDAALGAVVAAAGAAIVLMHTRGRSRDMYREAIYEAFPGDVTRELGASLHAAAAAGIAADRTIVDPGFGFAKKPEHSFRLLARLPDLAVLDRPLVAGVSRKSFLGHVLGGMPPQDRDWATAAAVTAAVLMGAHIVRVHAVARMKQVVQIADEIRRHDDA
jgi:dihydropteroate synthase